MANRPPKIVPQVDGVNYPDPVYDRVITRDEEGCLFQIRKLARIGVAACGTTATVDLTPSDFQELFEMIGQCAAQGLLNDSVGELSKGTVNIA